MSKTKIVFMGTPEFALPVLDALAENFDVVAVVTKPDAPTGRKQIMTESPVKARAKERGLFVLCPEKVKTPEFTEELAAFDADLFVTCAYGKILPKSVLDLPKYGCVNVHASLLPKYRGAAPLWRCVLNGETETGVTTMLTDVGMDTGDILLSEKIAITDDMTTGDVHDALSEIGAELIIKTIGGLLRGEIKPIKQNDEEATYAPMIDRDDGRINFAASCAGVHNIVRGCNPFPGAFGILKSGEKIKIWKTEKREDVDGTPGKILEQDKNGILVACGKGAILIKELQTDGAKRMKASDFINGHKLSEDFTV